MNDLSVLIKHREALLLAEVAAWLHDDFKHTDGHIQRHVKDAPRPLGSQCVDDLVPKRNISLLGKTISFLNAKKRKRQDFVRGYLNRCHYTAHIEKQDGDGSQSYPAYTSSPFGYEGPNFKIPANLTSDLRSRITWSDLGASPFADSQRKRLRGEIKDLFDRVGGDTRRPANEITLWEWGHTVGALYKAALAGALLGFRPEARDLRWRLLSVRFDGFSFFTKAHRLPDLLARRKLLSRALDAVQQLLEVDYPLGTEVYRDEEGSIFVVPGCERFSCTLDLLSLSDVTGRTLQNLILERIFQVLEGENIPKVKLDESPWWGQDPARKGADELPPIAEHLETVVTAPDPKWVAEQWKTTEQVCTTCGLRPQGPGRKAKDRGLCDICERRRGERSKAWGTDLKTTIWLGEVADINGRFALLVGRFDLEHWLDGSLVRTLAVRKPDDTNGHTANEVAKNPSFARIRRIWETTKRFWEEITGDLGRIVGQAGPRLEIRGTLSPSSLGLGPSHLYELVIGQRHLPVVWEPAQARFITADNLAYIARLLEDKVVDHEKAAGVIAGHLLGKQWLIEEPIGYGAKNKKLGTLSIQNVREMDSRYTPAIPILAEPRTFMAIIPANRALAVAEAIKTKYEREMGKVRNRLPLHLGIVYAQRHMPLRTLLDAGRRMLRQKAIEPMDQWRVIEDVHKQTGSLPEEVRDLAARSEQFEQWYVVRLQHLTSERSITWYVPAVMGDGKTEDDWYPYVFVKSFASARSTPSRWFKATNPWTGQDDGILVHVAELRTGDVVYFTPATLDFIWLDSAGRRFEIAYEGNGHRKGLSRRPYLLDELETLESIWRTLAGHLTTTQLHALSSLIEDKREAWEASPSDETFKQFCRALLANLEWRRKDGVYPWGNDREAWLDTWADYAVRGWIADAVKLHHHIMKQSAGSD